MIIKIGETYNGYKVLKVKYRNGTLVGILAKKSAEAWYTPGGFKFIALRSNEWEQDSGEVHI